MATATLLANLVAIDSGGRAQQLLSHFRGRYGCRLTTLVARPPILNVNGGERGMYHNSLRAVVTLRASRYALVASCCRNGSNREASRPELTPITRKPGIRPGFLVMAVREGFEPSNGVTRYTLSRRAPSATRTPHRKSFNLPLLQRTCPLHTFQACSLFVALLLTRSRPEHDAAL